MLKQFLAVITLAFPLLSQDPAALKRDAKESAAIQKLIVHQQIDQAKIGLILAKYAVSHNCPTGKAGLNQIAQLQCEAPPAPRPTAPPESKHE